MVQLLKNNLHRKITPVVPTADPATSTDISRSNSNRCASFAPGNPAIPMDDDTCNLQLRTIPGGTAQSLQNEAAHGS